MTRANKVTWKKHTPMKVKINPDFEKYKDFVVSMPQESYTLETVFCNKRNTVGTVRMDDGTPVVVKKFKRPTLVNCVVYTYFRLPKTQRAYNNALYLTQHGFDTALPIGYVEIFKNGFYHTGYFAQTFLPHETLRQAVARLENDEAEMSRLGSDFLDFLISMHEKDILMGDNNIDNFITHKDRGHYHFALIDVNRLYYGKKLSLKKIVFSFKQLNMPEEMEEKLNHKIPENT